MTEKKIKRAPFSFYKCGIKKGEKIYFKQDKKKVATVYDDRKICYKDGGESIITSVSGLAQKFLNRKNVRGTSYFTYKDETLDKIRDKIDNA